MKTFEVAEGKSLQKMCSFQLLYPQRLKSNPANFIIGTTSSRTWHNCAMLWPSWKRLLIYMPYNTTTIRQKHTLSSQNYVSQLAQGYLLDSSHSIVFWDTNHTVLLPSTQLHKPSVNSKTGRTVSYSGISYSIITLKIASLAQSYLSKTHRTVLCSGMLYSIITLKIHSRKLEWIEQHFWKIFLSSKL